MEYQFCVETNHDTRAFEALAAAEYRLYRKPRTGVYQLCAALAVFLLSLLWKGVDSLVVTWCLRVGCAVVVSALVLPVQWLREMRLRDQLALTFEEDERDWEYGLEYAFYENYFSVWGQENTRLVYYSAITALVETNDLFLIFLEGAGGHALKKADFTRGDPRRFAEFLSTACAQQWEEMAV